jgi:hypothetical protein
MKKNYSLELFVTFTIMSHSNGVLATDWQWIEGSQKLFDSVSIERLKSGNVRAWQKYSLPRQITENLDADLRRIGTRVNYQDYVYSVALWEFDCKTKRHGVVSVADYSSNGMVINSFDIDPPSLERVIPDSDGDIVFKTVCNAASRDKKQWQ